MADEPRNYAEEAARIVAGESRLIPEKAHLVALAGQVQSAVANVRVLAQILAAVMIDIDHSRLSIPAELLKQVVDTRTGVVLRSGTDGSITVLRQSAPPLPQPSVSVN